MTGPKLEKRAENLSGIPDFINFKTAPRRSMDSDNGGMRALVEGIVLAVYSFYWLIEVYSAVLLLF